MQLLINTCIILALMSQQLDTPFIQEAGSVAEDDPALFRFFSREFTPVLQQDSVIVSCKWKQYGLFKKDKPYRLVLKIENSNPYRVSLGFRVNYYWGAVRKMSSDRVEYCVKPGKRIRGKLWDLVFESGGYMEEQLKDPNFSFDLTEVRITQEPGCKAQLNLKFKSGSREIK